MKKYTLAVVLVTALTGVPTTCTPRADARIRSDEQQFIPERYGPLLNPDWEYSTAKAYIKDALADKFVDNIRDGCKGERPEAYANIDGTDISDLLGVDKAKETELRFPMPLEGIHTIFITLKGNYTKDDFYGHALPRLRKLFGDPSTLTDKSDQADAIWHGIAYEGENFDVNLHFSKGSLGYDILHRTAQ